ncbi:sensor histidine kinase [Sutcliffiella horikoshii]|uniref:sensor histidine kinase n=1 Tax=Sutcliffiella horikoshii TaxID=79883 RepID=UPI00203AF9E4|nr:sensor histidine kinase [Sutcliffiella horikoshii]MCM3620074.1 sensor histidine kinase [Sutcliffiella horikoshii]
MGNKISLIWIKLCFVCAILLIMPFYYSLSGTLLAVYLLAAGMYLGLYFSMPIWKAKWVTYLLASGVVVLVQHFILTPFDILPWLLVYFLLMEGMQSFATKQLVLTTMAVLLPTMFTLSVLAVSDLFYYHLFLFIMLIGVGALTHRYFRDNEKFDREWKSLLVEYRALKRQVLENEEVARVEERNRIARDIHDSVGHQLTALMMQLAVAEQAAGEGKIASMVKQSKQLARESLDGMRKAVKALQGEEEQGIASVIHLIRKLEAESQMRVQLTTKTGVLSQPLTNEQNIAVYRFVQEGLTNAMRHGSSREISIILEIIGEYSFQVKVENKMEISSPVEEGFGLLNMRKRMEGLNGRMEREVTGGYFSVKGIFPLKGVTY